MERRQKVRVLVDEIRRYEANPTRSQCLTVIRKIIRQYPKTFADMTADGSHLGCGYTSLLIQVKNRIENVNRGGVYAHHRASRSSSTYKRGPTDTYGCTKFLPKLPPEETNETVEQNRQTLVEIYRQEGAGGNFMNICPLQCSCTKWLHGTASTTAQQYPVHPVSSDQSQDRQGPM
ncbi:Peptide chain release factor 1 [Dissostichus eleginoides]|uniref:Peptide chain release factor 1 n=1 Tax=Dissostichus eleginoides TaxID=100907 RepID=A0AAD9C338_DISEL|nr:Peptide chain release factor 1 [Dissostichus eleginoides]